MAIPMSPTTCEMIRIADMFGALEEVLNGGSSVAYCPAFYVDRTHLRLRIQFTCQTSASETRAVLELAATYANKFAFLSLENQLGEELDIALNSQKPIESRSGLEKYAYNPTPTFWRKGPAAFWTQSGFEEVLDLATAFVSSAGSPGLLNRPDSRTKAS